MDLSIIFHVIVIVVVVYIVQLSADVRARIRQILHAVSMIT